MGGVGHPPKSPDSQVVEGALPAHRDHARVRCTPHTGHCHDCDGREDEAAQERGGVLDLQPVGPAGAVGDQRQGREAQRSDEGVRHPRGADAGVAVVPEDGAGLRDEDEPREADGGDRGEDAGDALALEQGRGRDGEQGPRVDEGGGRAEGHALGRQPVGDDEAPVEEGPEQDPLALLREAGIQDAGASFWGGGGGGGFRPWPAGEARSPEGTLIRRHSRPIV